MRRLPIGAELATDGRGVEVRVWAPTHDRVTIVDETARCEAVLDRGAHGYHAALVPSLGVGSRYRFRLGDDPALHADPASRYQPDGPHGPSQVIDPAAFAWSDERWRGIDPARHVIYELHVGTRLRREDPAFTDPRDTALDTATLSPQVFAVRYFQDPPEADRLLLVNLGPTFTATAIPEPLVAPPRGTGWTLAWSSEDPRYGGHGTPVPVERARTTIPARSAIVLAADAAARITRKDPA